MKRKLFSGYMKDKRFGNLFTKNAVIIAAGIFLPLVIICAGLFFGFQNIYHSEITQLSHAALSQLKEMLDMAQQSIDTIGVNLSAEHTVAEFIAREPWERPNYATVNGIKRVLSLLHNTTGDFVESVYVYSEKNGYVLPSTGDALPLMLFTDKAFMSECEYPRFERKWTSGRAGTEPVITTYFRVPFSKKKMPQGVIAVNMSRNWMNKLLKSVNDGCLEAFFIIDKDERIMYCADSAQLGKELCEVVTDRNDTMKVRSEETGRSYVGIVAYDSYNKRMAELGTIVAGLLLVCAGIAAGASYMISIQVFLPMRSILQMKEMHAAVLQSQINPHFLYNTMQTINFLAMSEGGTDNKASKAIGLLSSMFRSMMEASSDVTTIAKELEYTRAYIEIEAIRHEGEFEVTWDIDNAALDGEICKLTLQPIVENCIKHGFTRLNSFGRIAVAVKTDGEKITVSISDNGAGQTDAWIRETNACLIVGTEGTGFENIGMANVNQRIKLRFGNKYGIKYSGNGDGGLTALITIPRLVSD